MKKILLFLVVLVIGFYIAIFPSFVILPGVDCIAGCAIGVGFPFIYRTMHGGGIIGMVTPDSINYYLLVANTLIVLFIAIVITTLFAFVSKKK